MAGRAGALLELTRPANLVLGAATVPLGATMVLGEAWTSESVTVTALYATSVVAFMAAAFMGAFMAFMVLAFMTTFEGFLCFMARRRFMAFIGAASS